MLLAYICKYYVTIIIGTHSMIMYSAQTVWTQLCFTTSRFSPNHSWLFHYHWDNHARRYIRAIRKILRNDHNHKNKKIANENATHLTLHINNYGYIDIKYGPWRAILYILRKVVPMSWRVQNFVTIGWICYEQEHYKFSLDFEFHWTSYFAISIRLDKAVTNLITVGCI